MRHSKRTLLDKQRAMHYWRERYLGILDSPEVFYTAGYLSYLQDAPRDYIGLASQEEKADWCMGWDDAKGDWDDQG